jgi:O-antigen/teichoic acid export membrane protein
VKRPSHQETRDDEDNSLWRRLRRNVSIGVLGSAIAAAIRLVQAFLLTRFLQIEDYGRVLIVLNLFVFLESFFGLRVSDVMFRFFQSLREQRDKRALRGLLLFCLGICFASGLLIYLVVLMLSPSLAASIYSNPDLSPLFNIYGLTILISAFSGFYEPLLRMYDRFSAIVVPQVLGNLITLAILIFYFATTNGGGYNLRLVVVGFAIGALVQTIPPFVKAFSLVRSFLARDETRDETKETGQGLAQYRHELVRCLFNSNLSGYLKFAINPGDVFLLGLISSPTQVALFGLAKQLTSPLAVLQTTIQIAITPEITGLIAKLKLQQLEQLVARYVVSAFVFGGLFLIAAILLGRLLILHIFSAQYAPALPVFYCLIVAAWLLLVFLVFRPVAVSLDLLSWYNLALLMSTVIVMFLIVVGGLNALTMAYVQLAEAAILRLSFSLLVWNKLRSRSTARFSY